MKQRSITSFFIVLVVTLAVASKFLPYDIGDYVFDLFILCVTVVASFEMSHLMESCNKKVNKYLSSMYAIFNYIILICCFKLLEFYYILLIELAGLIVYFCLILITESIKNNARTFKENVMVSLNSLLVCFYPGFLFCLFLNINHIDFYAGVEYFSIAFILLVFAITMLSDTFAYLIGRTLKGPKLAPTISPNKTISGAIGGLLGGIAGSMLVYALLYNVDSMSLILTMYNLSWWHFLIVGLIGSLVSQIGDLVESKIKRVANIKDSGNILPGHGGMLDRIDAMIFCVTFLYVVCFIIIV